MSTIEKFFQHSLTWQKPLITVSQCALVALIGWQLALTTWQFWPQPAQTVQTAPTSAPAAGGEHTDYLAALDNLNLFGTPPAETEAAPAVPTVAPVSRLPAKITGLVASSNPQQSRVIIQLRGKDKMYHIGEVLEGANARIENIFPDRVIIDHNGKFESLLMYPDEKGQPQGAVTVPAAAPTRGRAPATRDKAARDKPPAPDNPASWSDLLKISPVQEDGQVRAYRLSPGKQPELLAKYGLQSGDLVTRMNGYDLSDRQQTMELMQKLPTLDTLDLTIERDGQEQDVQVKLQ